MMKQKTKQQVKQKSRRGSFFVKCSNAFSSFKKSERLSKKKDNEDSSTHPTSRDMDDEIIDDFIPRVKRVSFADCDDQTTMDDVVVLKNYLREIKKRKQIELQNIQDWKIEKKWKLDQKYRNCSSDAKFVSSDDCLTVNHLKEDNQLLREEWNGLKKNVEETMNANIELRKEYEFQSRRVHDRRWEAFYDNYLLEEIHEDENRKNEFLSISENNTQYLSINTLKRNNEKLRERSEKVGQERDISMASSSQLQKDYDCLNSFYQDHDKTVTEYEDAQKALVNEKRKKYIFCDAIDNIVQLLQSKCKDGELLLEVMVLANKLEKQQQEREKQQQQKEKKQAKQKQQKKKQQQQKEKQQHQREKQESFDTNHESDGSFNNDNRASRRGHQKSERNSGRTPNGNADASYNNDGIRVSSRTVVGGEIDNDRSNNCHDDGIRVTPSNKARTDYHNDDGIRVSTHQKEQENDNFYFVETCSSSDGDSFGVVDDDSNDANGRHCSSNDKRSNFFDDGIRVTVEKEKQADNYNYDCYGDGIRINS